MTNSFKLRITFLVINNLGFRNCLVICLGSKLGNIRADLLISSLAWSTGNQYFLLNLVRNASTLTTCLCLLFATLLHASNTSSSHILRTNWLSYQWTSSASRSKWLYWLYSSWSKWLYWLDSSGSKWCNWLHSSRS